MRIFNSFSIVIAISNAYPAVEALNNFSLNKGVTGVGQIITETETQSRFVQNTFNTMQIRVLLSTNMYTFFYGLKRC